MPLRTFKKRDLSPKLVEKFWNHVDKTGDCWIWYGRINYGHGVFNINSKARRSAARVAWVIIHGSIPYPNVVVQTCRNMLCMRPEHLQLSSYKSNYFTEGKSPKPPTKALAIKQDMTKIRQRLAEILDSLDSLEEAKQRWNLLLSRERLLN